MYSREETKALTDKVLNMAKVEAVELSFEGGERAGTRFANSTITTNLVQYDQQLTIAVRHGEKQGTASTRELDDESLKATIDEAQEAAQKARDNPNLTPLVKGAQDYLEVDAVVPATAELGPGEHAAWVKQSIEICEKKGVLGAGYIPKAYQTTCLANSEGLFAYYQYAETGFILTCRMVSGGGSGWAGVTGAKDLSQVNVAELTEIAANVKSQKPRAVEPGRYTTIIEPRPMARLLSTMIENGEIAGPVPNFRWNMSPLVAFANISAVGKSVPIHTGEAYDGPGTALVPAVRVEDFCMTSVSPAV